MSINGMDGIVDFSKKKKIQKNYNSRGTSNTLFPNLSIIQPS